MPELLQQAFAELSKLPDKQQDAFGHAMPSANATNLFANLQKATEPLENIDPDDTPYGVSS